MDKKRYDEFIETITSYDDIKSLKTLKDKGVIDSDFLMVGYDYMLFVSAKYNAAGRRLDDLVEEGTIKFEDIPFDPDSLIKSIENWLLYNCGTIAVNRFIHALSCDGGYAAAKFLHDEMEWYDKKKEKKIKE